MFHYVSTNILNATRKLKIIRIFTKPITYFNDLLFFPFQQIFFFIMFINTFIFIIHRHVKKKTIFSLTRSNGSKSHRKWIYIFICQVLYLKWYLYLICKSIYNIQLHVHIFQFYFLLTIYFVICSKNFYDSFLILEKLLD